MKRHTVRRQSKIRRGEPGLPAKSASWEKSELATRLKNSAPGRMFGYELESLGAGSAVMSMRVRARHKQIHGVVHGGILASLADTAGAMAAYPMLPRGTRLATVEIKISYLEPVDRGPIFAESRVLRLGRTLVIAECEIIDADGNLAAKALMTFTIMRVAGKEDGAHAAATQRSP
jgi:uncharacterized protein (TIGR00369 family)